MSRPRSGRYHPSAGAGGRRALAGDITVVMLMVLFASMGFKVHGAIADLADVTRGVEDAGRAGTTEILDLARLVGWLAFLVPTALVLSQSLPTRLRRVRDLRA